MTEGATTAPGRVEPTAVHIPSACPPVLAPFVAAGVLTAGDVHVATALCRLHDVTDERVVLAAAMAARAPRVGHVCLDVDTTVSAITEDETASPMRLLDGGVATVDGTDGGDQLDLMATLDPIAGLPWPDPDAWLRAVGSSDLVRGRDGVPAMVVHGRRIYLARYHRHEQAVAVALRSRAVDDHVDESRLASMLARLFPGVDRDDPQRRAAEAAARRRLTVVAGGPGTGKTWTVARVLAVLADQAEAADRPLQIALAAPTGKAAARLDAGLREALQDMDLEPAVAARLAGVERGTTLHGLIGARPGARPWHGPTRPLPHDVVVVDEMSMSSLSLAARLLEAVRPEARIVLVGDPAQLASVEAGSVLADVVAASDALGPSLVHLTRVHRFDEGSGIAGLAAAIQSGDGDAAIMHLRDADDLTWLQSHDDLDEVRAAVVARGRAVRAAARDGDAAAALSGLQELVVLCAHRAGSRGVDGWNGRVDGWLAHELTDWRPWERWQPGRPLIATRNDRLLQVFNGDLGVVLATGDGPRVAFDADRPAVAPSRLEAVEHVHAMTIHKSQGSQWRHVVVVLPDGPSRILTRELLYTAATRAESHLTVIGDEATIRAAIARPVRRASGLADRLDVLDDA